MKAHQKFVLLVAAGVLSLASAANAEVSQRDQQRAAQRAYEASARDHEEAARGFQRAKEIAEKVRDTAVDVLKAGVVKSAR